MAGAAELAIVIVSYNSAAQLPALLRSVLDQADERDEVVVVDNHSSDGSAGVATRVDPRVCVVAQTDNLGFGAGCHAGADATRAPLLLFLNPDSELEPGCLARMRAAAARHPGWGAWQAAVILDDERINTDGGVVHYTGIGWAGHCGAPLGALPSAPVAIAFPSGAAMAIRRPVWDELGGFDPGYFMYCEDLDLGLRVWLSGREVGLVPDARVRHDYSFAKGATKWFYLERNRLRTVLSVYPARLLLALSPALAALELVLVLIAARDGWLRPKLRADLAIALELAEIRRRRRRVGAHSRLGAAGFAMRLTSSLDSPYLGIAPDGTAARAQAVYWSLIRRALPVTRRRSGPPLPSA